jgi:hypothetical protein
MVQATGRQRPGRGTIDGLRLDPRLPEVHIWLLLTLRGMAPRTSFWRDAQFDTIRLCLIKVAGRVTEMVTRIKVALPTAYPYRIGFAALAGGIARLPP